MIYNTKNNNLITKIEMFGNLSTRSLMECDKSVYYYDKMITRSITCRSVCLLINTWFCFCIENIFLELFIFIHRWNLQLLDRILHLITSSIIGRFNLWSTFIYLSVVRLSDEICLIKLRKFSLWFAYLYRIFRLLKLNPTAFVLILQYSMIISSN